MSLITYQSQKLAPQSIMVNFMQVWYAIFSIIVYLRSSEPRSTNQIPSPSNRLSKLNVRQVIKFYLL